MQPRNVGSLWKRCLMIVDVLLYSFAALQILASHKKHIIPAVYVGGVPIRGITATDAIEMYPGKRIEIAVDEKGRRA
jgi:hypothetical protein